MKNNHSYFILSSSCKLVRGAYRAIIIDYERLYVYYIPLEYYDLLQMMDRKLLCEIEKEIEDEESLNNFHTFLTFLMNNELGFQVPNLSLFPKISEEIRIEPRHIQNAILEIDETIFEIHLFHQVCKELRTLGCIDIQIRLYSSINDSFIQKVVEELRESGSKYIEIHCRYQEGIEDLAKKLIQDLPLLGRIFIYEAPAVQKISVQKESLKGYPVHLGEIYFIDMNYDCENYCGIINIQSLDFSHIYNFNRLKEHNGCLYKKVTIDRKGYIKNCPSFCFHYGNIREISITEVIQTPKFTQYWYLHKDLIETCQNCEFRYNCTDCRAFIKNQADLFSRPSKCKYNIQTGEWE